MHRIRYSAELNVVNARTESHIDDLQWLLIGESKRLSDAVYYNKCMGIVNKFIGITFLKAEIEFLDSRYAIRDALMEIELGFIISKIETFLSCSRSLLDVLSYCLARSLGFGNYVQSINDLRKRGDVPDWLRDYFVASLDYSRDRSFSKNGWLCNLVTDDAHGQSMRDFVVHMGTVSINPLRYSEDEAKFIFKLRKGETFSYHVEDMVSNIFSGLNGFFHLILENIKSGEGEDEVRDKIQIPVWCALCRDEQRKLAFLAPHDDITR